LVENVEASIMGISETEFEGNESNVLQDIYFHAIPQMMALLDKALKARTVQLSKKRDTSALEEIIRIQEMSANLCRKASRRKAKLSTKRPVKQTINAIGPQLKSLLKKFNAELRERKRCLNQRENNAKRAKLRRLEEESDRQAWQEVQRVKQARNQEIWEAISQKPVGPRPGMAVQLPQARNQEAERRRCQAQWTEEQDVQLFIEFFANGLEDLSGKDVYRAAGDCFRRPLLKGLERTFAGQQATRTYQREDSVLQRGSGIDFEQQGLPSPRMASGVGMTRSGDHDGDTVHAFAIAMAGPFASSLLSTLTCNLALLPVNTNPPRWSAPATQANSTAAAARLMSLILACSDGDLATDCTCASTPRGIMSGVARIVAEDIRVIQESVASYGGREARYGDGES
ncbi:MAG: hypothetical protein Q9177_005171, partial [Variospora cf. flavescens]